MEIGYKIYEKLRDTFPKEFERLQLEMALTCEAKGWSMEDGYDENGNRYLIINPRTEYVPTDEELQQYFEDAIEAYMDSVVQTRNYKNIHTAASYVNSTNEKFAKEGAACNKWRDDVWDKCYAILGEVKAGERPIPTLEEVIAELPVLVW